MLMRWIPLTALSAAFVTTLAAQAAPIPLSEQLAFSSQGGVSRVTSVKAHPTRKGFLEVMVAGGNNCNRRFAVRMESRKGMKPATVYTVSNLRSAETSMEIQPACGFRVPVAVMLPSLDATEAHFVVATDTEASDRRVYLETTAVKGANGQWTFKTERANAIGWPIEEDGEANESAEDSAEESEDATLIAQGDTMAPADASVRYVVPAGLLNFSDVRAGRVKGGFGGQCDALPKAGIKATANLLAHAGSKFVMGPRYTDRALTNQEPSLAYFELLPEGKLPADIDTGALGSPTEVQVEMVFSPEFTDTPSHWIGSSNISERVFVSSLTGQVFMFTLKSTLGWVQIPKCMTGFFNYSTEPKLNGQDIALEPGFTLSLPPSDPGFVAETITCKKADMTAEPLLSIEYKPGTKSYLDVKLMSGADEPRLKAVRSHVRESVWGISGTTSDDQTRVRIFLDARARGLAVNSFKAFVTTRSSQASAKWSPRQELECRSIF